MSPEELKSELIHFARKCRKMNSETSYPSFAALAREALARPKVLEIPERQADGTLPTIHFNIEFLRWNLGLTVAEMARNLGVDPKTYRAWERGDAIPAKSILSTLHDLWDEVEVLPPITPNRIAVLRSESYRNNEDFAKKCGVTKETVRRWISGETAPRPAAYRKLALAWKALKQEDQSQ